MHFAVLNTYFERLFKISELSDFKSGKVWDLNMENALDPLKKCCGSLETFLVFHLGLRSYVSW